MFQIHTQYLGYPIFNEFFVSRNYRKKSEKKINFIKSFFIGTRVRDQFFGLELKLFTDDCTQINYCTEEEKISKNRNKKKIYWTSNTKKFRKVKKNKKIMKTYEFYMPITKRNFRNSVHQINCLYSDFLFFLLLLSKTVTDSVSTPTDFKSTNDSSLVYFSLMKFATLLLLYFFFIFVVCSLSYSMFVRFGISFVVFSGTVVCYYFVHFFFLLDFFFFGFACVFCLCYVLFANSAPLSWSHVTVCMCAGEVFDQ